MPPVTSSQLAIYESLRQGNLRVLAELYPALHKGTVGVVRRLGGTPDEATDLLHEAILATVNNIQLGRYVWTGEAKLTTYIIAIARNLWRETLRRRNQLGSDADLPEEADDEADTLLADQHAETRRLAAETALEQLDPKCRRTLELYYWEKLSMAQLAQQQGWANEAVARKNKSNCLRKLRQWVDEYVAKAAL